MNYQIIFYLPKEHFKAVKEAMKKVHPYEVPAYGVVALENI